METFLRYVVPAVLGLVAGVIGSLVAPWIHWQIEKRRAVTSERRAFIAGARGYLDKLNSGSPTFMASDYYERLIDHLSSETKSALMDGSMLGAEAPYEDHLAYQGHIRRDLVNLEKKWGLI